jgi:hypothetical protein
MTTAGDSDGERRNGDGPTELLYPPSSSWQPALIAAGLAGIVASLFTWWPYGVVGAIVALVAAWAWIRDARSDFSRLPREQRVTTAVLPAVPLKK